ncbi:MAG: hypothetical protein LBF22_01090, partial [Deltaproteobacteria bacterium]|nr:hypothetical protein [Deltaproteobacteria bacterium]
MIAVHIVRARPAGDYHVPVPFIGHKVGKSNGQPSLKCAVAPHYFRRSLRVCYVYAEYLRIIKIIPSFLAVWRLDWASAKSEATHQESTPFVTYLDIRNQGLQVHIVR